MFPGMNPRQMQHAMRQLGIKQEELDAEQVIIVLKGKRIVLDRPSVQKVNMMGQSSYQVAGNERIESAAFSEEDITGEDIKTVVEQTGCTAVQAKDALLAVKGDIAEAILKIESFK